MQLIRMFVNSASESSNCIVVKPCAIINANDCGEEAAEIGLIVPASSQLSGGSPAESREGSSHLLGGSQMRLLG